MLIFLFCLYSKENIFFSFFFLFLLVKDALTTFRANSKLHWFQSQSLVVWFLNRLHLGNTRSIIRASEFQVADFQKQKPQNKLDKQPELESAHSTWLQLVSRWRVWRACKQFEMKQRKILWSKYTLEQNYKLHEKKKKKSQTVTAEQSNWNLLLPPLGRAPATSPQHKPCLLLPVAKCGLSFGHVKLKTSYRKNYSEFATSALVLFWLNH